MKNGRIEIASTHSAFFNFHSIFSHSFFASPHSHQFRQRHRWHDVSDAVLIALCLSNNRTDIIRGQHTAERVGAEMFDASS